MQTAIYVLLIVWLNGFWASLQPPQTGQSVRIRGICFDVTTAVYLPVRVSAQVQGQTVLLGEADKEGKVDLCLPIAATQITFESRGYHTVTMPVKVIDTPSDKAAFMFSAYMSKTDSARTWQMTQLALSFSFEQQAGFKYTIESKSTNPKVYTQRTPHGNNVGAGDYREMHLKNWRVWPSFRVEGAIVGPYRVVVKACDDRVVLDETFTVGEGITFKELIPREAPTTSATSPVGSLDKPISMPQNRLLFFGQSRYELTNEAEVQLDSISTLLIAQPDWKITITGHTENLGERKLNITLSEYRARRVASYLRQKGIAEGRMRVDWKGPGEGGRDQSRNRRVVVQFSEN
ncbi:MAG: OmpA family protein [Cytophagales bacterium]|nr:MAG: OmpA family protein [Cytophagales bacterium]